MTTHDVIINMATERRPSSFSDIIGQPFATGLGKRLGQGKVSGQGYIISGPRGCGKTTLARIIAQSLNCENRDTETGDPCNKCPSCLLIAAGHHPQIIEINAAANRGINEVRELLKESTLSVPKGYRVFIFDEAHMFTKDAFSVLLKPMEEPPSHVVYIMATTNPEVIPETILSRSPIIPILPLSDEELREVLDKTVAEGMKNDAESWGKITETDMKNSIMASSGSARQAITHLSSIVFHGISDTITADIAPEVATALLQGSAEKTLSLVSNALKEKTAEPVTLITSVMDDLLSNMTHAENPEVIARIIAKLSVVSSEVRTSSPAIVIASKMAACIPDSVPAVSATPSFKKQSKQWSIDTAIDALLDNENTSRYLTKKWRNVLDDESQSDISIKKGMVVIRVPSPDKELEESLTRIFGEKGFILESK